MKKHDVKLSCFVGLGRVVFSDLLLFPWGMSSFFVFVVSLIVEGLQRVLLFFFPRSLVLQVLPSVRRSVGLSRCPSVGPSSVGLSCCRAVARSLSRSLVSLLF